jgi:hypothetical protein
VSLQFTNFEFTGLVRGPEEEAARRSLIPLKRWPLTPQGWVANPLNVAKLSVLCWRKVAVALYRANWLDIHGEGKLTFAINCPPVGVGVRPRRYPCRRNNVCPHCWGRFVKKQYEAVAPLLYGRHGLVVTGLRLEHSIPANAAQGALELLYSYVADHKRNVLDAAYPDALGASVCFTIEPEGEAGWRLTQRLLVVTLASVARPSYSQEDFRDDSAVFHGVSTTRSPGSAERLAVLLVKLGGSLAGKDSSIAS